MFKKILVVSLAAGCLSSCSFRQYNAVTTGSSLGGMIGSAIGGLTGGYRGSNIGTVVGMAAGGTVAAVITQSKREKATSADGNGEIYAPYPASPAPSGKVLPQPQPTVERMYLVNARDKAVLVPGATATLYVEFYNRTNGLLSNVTPKITASTRRVSVSSPAKVVKMQPGDGVRYQAVVTAQKRLKKEPVTFTVTFDGVTKKTLTVEVQ